jgi:hypothetical protein
MSVWLPVVFPGVSPMAGAINAHRVLSCMLDVLLVLCLVPWPHPLALGFLFCL